MPAMSENGYSPSQSQQLSASTSSLSKSSSKQISQTYKQASQLFLTRRLQDSLSILESVITPVQDEQQQQQQNGNDGPTAAISTASSNLRIKVWNLYITILSAIVDLGPEEGKRQFGQAEWKAISNKVRDGEIWDTVVKTGYKGQEGSVDADVVYNLATLLLNHSPSQKLNQQRLETYLSSYGLPDLDISSRLQDSEAEKRRRRVSPAKGTDTPKDLSIRVRLLELFTLHVLPRNEEWDYAREFVNMSEVLDEDKKEAFLQALDGVWEEKERGAQREAEIQREKEEELERQRKQREDAESKAEEEAAKYSAEPAAPQPHQKQNHARANSEVDYGIDRSNPNGLAKTRPPKSALKSSRTASSSNRQTSRREAGSSAAAGSAQKPASLARLRALATLLVTMVKSMSRTMFNNPLAFLRTLLLALGFLMALGRPDVRDRIRRVTGAGWEKIRSTVGMGVKVSYI